MTTLDFTPSEVSVKLAKISEVMSDAYYFVKLRAFAETWQIQADNGNMMAKDMLDAIDKVHRLCEVVQKH